MTRRRVSVNNYNILYRIEQMEEFMKDIKQLDFNEKIEDFIKEFDSDGIYNLQELKDINFWELYEKLLLKIDREDWGYERILGESIYWEYFVDEETCSYESGGGSSKAFEYLFLIKEKKVYKWETCCEF